MAERKVRSKEERLAEIEAKIESHKKTLAILEEKRERILNPPVRKSKKRGINSLIKSAKEAGLSPEEIAAKLGLEL